MKSKSLICWPGPRVSFITNLASSLKSTKTSESDEKYYQKSSRLPAMLDWLWAVIGWKFRVCIESHSSAINRAFMCTAYSRGNSRFSTAVAFWTAASADNWNFRCQWLEYLFSPESAVGWTGLFDSVQASSKHPKVQWVFSDFQREFSADSSLARKIS